jgi:hypothetical protein
VLGVILRVGRTPSPVAPTESLVVGGLYRYVRNPMYLAVAAVIVGQAALLGRWLLVAFAALFGATVWSFVHWYEEPSLRRRFGADYEELGADGPGAVAAPAPQAGHRNFIGSASTPESAVARLGGTAPTDRYPAPKASAIRTVMSFFTSVLGRGLSIGKWSDPFVHVYLSVSLASWGMTDPLCGR